MTEKIQPSLTWGPFELIYKECGWNFQIFKIFDAHINYLLWEPVKYLNIKTIYNMLYAFNYYIYSLSVTYILNKDFVTVAK